MYEIRFMQFTGNISWAYRWF